MNIVLYCIISILNPVKIIFSRLLLLLVILYLFSVILYKVWFYYIYYKLHYISRQCYILNRNPLLLITLNNILILPVILGKVSRERKSWTYGALDAVFRYGPVAVEADVVYAESTLQGLAEIGSCITVLTGKMRRPRDWRTALIWRCSETMYAKDGGSQPLRGICIQLTSRELRAWLTLNIEPLSIYWQRLWKYSMLVKLGLSACLLNAYPAQRLGANILSVQFFQYSMPQLGRLTINK